MRRSFRPAASLRKRGIVVRRGVVKIPPNEPCPCGSGAKYKRCCGGARGLTGWWRRRRAERLWRERHPPEGPDTGH